MQVHVTRSGIGGVYGHPATRCDAGGCAAGTELYYADLVPSQWKEGDIAEAVPETAPGRPEAPIPCINCGSPACEWPGECDDEAECVACGHYRHEHDADHSCKRFIFPTECNACGAVLKDGVCPVCTEPLDAPEEILDILNALIEWDAEMGCFENEVWDRARAIRDRLVVK